MNVALIANEIDSLRKRHRRNVPRHTNPDAFHEEKSEIDRGMEAIVIWLRTGCNPVDR